MPRRVANAGKSSLPVSELNESTKQTSRGSLNRVVLLISISFLISGLIGLLPLMIKMPSGSDTPDVSGDFTNPSQQPSSVDIDTAEINDLTVSTSPTESEVTSTVLMPSAAPNPLLRPTETTLFPSQSLTVKPTKLPTKQPSLQPTKEPSLHPTRHPTTKRPTRLPTTNLPTNKPTNTEVVFHVMGDIPYKISDEACLTLDLHTLAQQQLTSNTQTNFIVHVGDVQSAQKTRCVEYGFSNARRLMQPSENSTVPIFMLAGDNDWNDCPQTDVAWGHFSNYLGRFEELWGEKKLNHLDVRRQPSRDENFSMYKDGVLFLGMNIVGGAVHDAVEWMERLEDNLEWFMESVNRYNIRALVIFGHANPRNVHSGFFTPLATEIENLAIPTLYMCGDSHFWGVREKFMGVDNWTKVRVDMGRYAPPVKVTVVEEEDDDLMLGVFKVECESRDTGGGCGGGAGADPTQWEQLC